MKKVFLTVIVGSICLFMAGNTSAFDGNRKGFVLGFGLGHGSVSVSETYATQEVVNKSYTPDPDPYYYESDPQEDFDLSLNGLTTDFRIGFGPSQNMNIYFSNNAAILKEQEFTVVQGLTGIGASYYLKANGPTVYFTGTYGVATLVAVSGAIGESFVLGNGYSMGAGFEFANHYSLEATLIKGTYGDDYEGEISAFRVTLNAVAF